MIFERKILRRVFGPKRNNEGKYEIRSNTELAILFNDPVILATRKSQRIKWIGHVRRAEGKQIRTVKKCRPNQRPS